MSSLSSYSIIDHRKSFVFIKAQFLRVWKMLRVLRDEYTDLWWKMRVPKVIRGNNSNNYWKWSNRVHLEHTQSIFEKMEIGFNNLNFLYCFRNWNCLAITWVACEKCKGIAPVPRCEFGSRTGESAWESSTLEIQVLGVPRQKTLVPEIQCEQTKNPFLHQETVMHCTDNLWTLSHTLMRCGFIINSPCVLELMKLALSIRTLTTGQC